jgi:hypothetical protein
VGLSHLTLLAAAAVAAVAQVGTGATVLHEPFDYASSDIGGANGGAGFSGAWTNPTTYKDWRVAAAGLSCPGIDSTGKAADSLLNNRYENARAFDATGLTGDGSEVWFSFLYNIASGSEDDPGSVSFFDGKDGWGASFSDNKVFALAGGTTAASGIDSGTVGETHVVVGKITFSDAGSDTVDLWLDDVTASGSADSSVSADLAGPTGEVYLNGYIKTWDVVVDELRLGETLADVTAQAAPIPEPLSALALLVGAGALAHYTRWRRR